MTGMRTMDAIGGPNKQDFMKSTSVNETTNALNIMMNAGIRNVRQAIGTENDVQVTTVGADASSITKCVNIIKTTHAIDVIDKGKLALGKYFVYVNCTTCKIKSELILKSKKSVDSVGRALNKDISGLPNLIMPKMNKDKAKSETVDSENPNITPKEKITEDEEGEDIAEEDDEDEDYEEEYYDEETKKEKEGKEKKRQEDGDKKEKEDEGINQNHAEDSEDNQQLATKTSSTDKNEDKIKEGKSTDQKPDESEEEEYEDEDKMEEGGEDEKEDEDEMPEEGDEKEDEKEEEEDEKKEEGENEKAVEDETGEPGENRKEEEEDEKEEEGEDKKEDEDGKEVEEDEKEEGGEDKKEDEYGKEVEEDEIKETNEDEKEEDEDEMEEGSEDEKEEDEDEITKEGEDKTKEGKDEKEKEEDEMESNEDEKGENKDEMEEEDESEIEEYEDEKEKISEKKQVRRIETTKKIQTFEGKVTLSYGSRSQKGTALDDKETDDQDCEDEYDSESEGDSDDCIEEDEVCEDSGESETDHDADEKHATTVQSRKVTDKYGKTKKEIRNLVLKGENNNEFTQTESSEDSEVASEEDEYKDNASRMEDSNTENKDEDSEQEDYLENEQEDTGDVDDKILQDVTEEHVTNYDDLYSPRQEKTKNKPEERATIPHQSFRLNYVEENNAKVRPEEITEKSKITEDKIIELISQNYPKPEGAETKGFYFIPGIFNYGGIRDASNLEDVFELDDDNEKQMYEMENDEGTYLDCVGEEDSGKTYGKVDSEHERDEENDEQDMEEWGCEAVDFQETIGSKEKGERVTKWGPVVERETYGYAFDRRTSEERKVTEVKEQTDEFNFEF